MDENLQKYHVTKTHATKESLSFLVEAAQVHMFIQFILTHLSIRDLTIEKESLEQLILEIFKTKQIQRPTE